MCLLPVPSPDKDRSLLLDFSLSIPLIREQKQQEQTLSFVLCLGAGFIILLETSICFLSFSQKKGHNTIRTVIKRTKGKL